MNRHSVARICWVVSMVAAVLAAAAPAGAQARRRTPAAAPAGDVRLVQPLFAGWRFVQDDALTEAAALAESGAAWQAVSLPHTWNAQDAASTTATVPYKRGRGWYRLVFDGPRRGARHWLQFDGASIVADVWLNGKKLGQHRGAFTTFRFDVTGALRPGQNVLLVKTDNSAPRADTDVTAIAPLSGDFNMSGGLYRGVFLVSTKSATHLALDDLGSSGVFARTTSLGVGAAAVTVRAKLANDAPRGAICIVRTRLVDVAGRVAAEARKSVSLPGKGKLEVDQDLQVPKPHPWQGTADPYLYRLIVEVSAPGGAVLDRVAQPFGLRQMSFDPDGGFSLNGRSMPLHGVAMHQDYLGKAWAITSRETDQSLALVKELGANTLRLAHYPHYQYTLQQADRLGLVVWAEVPFVNGTRVACTSDEPTSEFTANLRQQLQELIRQQYNHASVGMWSIGNETTMTQVRCPGGKPGPDNVTPVLRDLQRLAKAEDPSRVTTLADVSEGMNALGGFIAVGGISDIWAVNRYFLWYYGESANDLARNLDALHAKYPKQPIGVSEYGAGAALSDHTDNPLGGPVASFNTSVPRVYQPEEYAAYVHEQNYAVMTARKYVWGTYVWSMFDFGSGIRNEGDVRGTNTKGLVTFDRRTRKDPFFFYKANWSAEPVTHIVGRRYTRRAYAVTDVKVYSNAASVQLVVNGTPLGTLTAAQCPQSACVFKEVPLRPGANTIVARGVHGARTVTDEVQWTLANAADVYIAAGQATTGFTSAAGALYGSDNFFDGGRGSAVVQFALTGRPDPTPVKGAADPRDAQLYAAYRTGRFRYDIPMPNGTYEVTLGFLEPDKGTTVGARVFSVAANGATAIENLDVLREAGAYRTSIARTFLVTVNQGNLELVFTPSAGDAVVSNIAVRKQ